MPQNKQKGYAWSDMFVDYDSYKASCGFNKVDCPNAGCVEKWLRRISKSIWMAPALDVWYHVILLKSRHLRRSTCTKPLWSAPKSWNQVQFWLKFFATSLQRTKMSIPRRSPYIDSSIRILWKDNQQLCKKSSITAPLQIAYYCHIGKRPGEFHQNY